MMDRLKVTMLNPYGDSETRELNISRENFILCMTQHLSLFDVSSLTNEERMFILNGVAYRLDGDEDFKQPKSWFIDEEDH